jgi:hypothetical protein
MLWAWRVELALLAVAAAPVGAAGDAWGPPWAISVAGAVALAVLAPPWSRRRLVRLLRRCHARRSLLASIRRLAITPFAEQLPTVRRVREVPAGFRMEARVPPGGCVDDLERVAERIAADLGARDVRVRRYPDHAGRAEIVLVRRDPLADPAPLGWPAVTAELMSLWDPVPVGVDEDGRTVSMTLPEHNLLLGGEPGAGKSAALSLLTAAAALDPSVKLWLLDGKLVELATWAGCAEHSVGSNVAEAVEVLDSLRVEMGVRYAELLAQRRRKVGPGDGHALHVVVCDELAMYLTGGDRKERTEFAESLRDLVARGRAAGVIVLAATQKPASDIVPTSLRDLFGFRWALRCATRDASDTILGAGWATLGYSAAEIDARCRGVGYLLHEGGQPTRLRSYWLDDPDLFAVAERAEALRRSAVCLETP